MTTRLNRPLSLRTAWRILRLLLILAGVMFFMGGASLPPGGLSSQVGALTRDLEFEYGTWTMDAVTAKLANWALSLERFIPPDTQSEIVLAYLAQVQSVNTLKTELLLTISDPDIQNPESASQALRTALHTAQQRLDTLAPVAESILQIQLMAVIEETGLAQLGQVTPPSLYRASDMPRSLVISPRTEIAQTLDVSLLPGLDASAMDTLEEDIFRRLDHSALIVPIGGIGTYPTMVMQTADLVWLTEVIAHEWVHNYLTLRPLGINYFTTAELRTINETTASLAGKELGRLLLEKFYPEHLPPDPDPSLHVSASEVPEPVVDPNAFNFRKEMRITRVEVDRLLAEGQIEAAEAYMEARRNFFWDNGFPIRKLNQAYFAFYGAYNDIPGGGAAGADPVGPAVTAFRDQFTSLADFLKAISKVNSFGRLLELLDA